MTLAAAAALAWLGLGVYADYGYHKLQPLETVSAERLPVYAARLQELLELDASHGRARLRLAHVLGLAADRMPAGGEQNSMRLAALAHLRLSRRVVNTQDSLYLEADLHDKLGRPEEAKRMMADCVLINPTHVQYNDAYLRLAFTDRTRLEALRRQGQAASNLQAVREEYALAARNWAVRAPHDPNSHLFLGNYYVEPLFALEAYRCFLVGLSNPDWMGLKPEIMIRAEAPPGQFSVMHTLGQIVDLKLVKPYQGLSGTRAGD